MKTRQKEATLFRKCQTKRIFVIFSFPTGMKEIILTPTVITVL
jgi:hypothetical protein